MTLKQLIEGTEGYGRTFDLFIQVLIILSLVSFSIETLPGLSDDVREALWYFEAVSVAIFTVEYLLRVYVADSKTGFIFSFYGIVDLAAILPFYVATGVDLRSIRIVRLFRVFRIFKMLRYGKAIERFQKAIARKREEFVLFFAACAFLIYVSAVGIYYFENPVQPEAFASIIHSLWWAVATLTTVGYGDIYPVTAGGRLFTFFVLMVGLGIVAVPAGLIAASLSQVFDEEKEEDE